MSDELTARRKWIEKHLPRYIESKTPDGLIEEAKMRLPPFKGDLMAFLDNEERALKRLIPNLPAETKEGYDVGLHKLINEIRDSHNAGNYDWAHTKLYHYYLNRNRAQEAESHSFANTHRARQKEKSKKAHEKRWGDKELRLLIEAVISGLAMYEEYGEKPKTKDLWPLFYSALDEYGLNPNDTSNDLVKDFDRITWSGNDKGISYKSFENKITKARKQ